MIRKVPGTPYFLVGRRLAPSSQAEPGLERCQGQPSSVEAKDKFVEANLELLATHALMSPGQPLLQIADRSVRQGLLGVGSQHIASA